MASKPRLPPVPPPRSSPADRAEILKSSPRPTPPASRWCSPASATSGIEPIHYLFRGLRLCGRAALQRRDQGVGFGFGHVEAADKAAQGRAAAVEQEAVAF